MHGLKIESALNFASYSLNFLEGLLTLSCKAHLDVDNYHGNTDKPFAGM